jgi:hypothetical protein
VSSDRPVTPVTAVTNFVHSHRGALRVKRFAQTVWTVPGPTLLQIRGQYESDERAG